MDEKTALSIFMDEATHRGLSSFKIPRYEHVFPCRIIAPHQNGNAWITVKYWVDTEVYEASEFSKHFINGERDNIKCAWGIFGKTPCELLDKLLKIQASYPFSTDGTYLPMQTVYYCECSKFSRKIISPMMETRTFVDKKLITTTVDGFFKDKGLDIEMPATKAYIIGFLLKNYDRLDNWINPSIFFVDKTEYLFNTLFEACDNNLEKCSIIQIDLTTNKYRYAGDYQQYEEIDIPKNIRVEMNKLPEIFQWCSRCIEYSDKHNDFAS